MKLHVNNIDIFVSNDYIKVQNKSDIKQLREMEDKYEADICSKADSQNKTNFQKLDAKIDNETLQINYKYTSDLLEELFKKLELPIKITPA